MIQRFSLEELDLAGAYLVRPFCSTDERGSFVKDYSRAAFEEMGLFYKIEEVFYTRSHKGVIRATHFQLGRQQPKLVRCVSGHVYDVIVDLRKGSPTYGRWRGFHLTGDNMQELLIPACFGHGYLVIEDSIVSYKCAEGFYAEGDSGITFDDPDLGIDWPLELVGGLESVILSDKDRSLMSFREYDSLSAEAIGWGDPS